MLAQKGPIIRAFFYASDPLKNWPPRFASITINKTKFSKNGDKDENRLSRSRQAYPSGQGRH